MRTVKQIMDEAYALLQASQQSRLTAEEALAELNSVIEKWHSQPLEPLDIEEIRRRLGRLS